LVTVITVVFNGINTLEATIMSVLEQSYDNVEYIVIDGGSSDGTLDLLRKYEFAVDFWVSERDKGIYDAMNKGLRMAQGKWVALLNADDTYFTRDALSKLAALDDDVYVAASDVMMHTKEGLKRFVIDERRPLYKNVPYMHTGMFVRSDLYSTLGGFRDDLRIASDIDFIMRIMESGVNVYRFSEPFVVMRDDGVSVRSFRQGRREYRKLYVERGGGLFWSYIGYFSSLVEKRLYDNKTCRGIFRFAKRVMGQ
jgi:glycosyltransferase involved in cell wall biosynthesis